MRSIVAVVVFVAAICTGLSAQAQTDEQKAAAAKKTADAQKDAADSKKAAVEAEAAADKAAAKKKADDEVKKAADEGKLGGFKFGVAIGFEAYRDPYVNEAETVGPDRIVRISDSQKMKPSLWLETHYLWDGWAYNHGFTHSAPGFYIGVRAIGPNAETFETFDAFSLGAMWAFKRKRIGADPAGQIAESINVGFGPVWHRTRVLASGIVEGQPLPTQFQDIKYDKKDETSWMLMISVGF
jgi:hypothetical protein